MALPNLLTVDNDFLPSNALEVHILCRIMLDPPPARGNFWTPSWSPLHSDCLLSSSDPSQRALLLGFLSSFHPETRLSFHHSVRLVESSEIA